MPRARQSGLEVQVAPSAPVAAPGGTSRPPPSGPSAPVRPRPGPSAPPSVPGSRPHPSWPRPAPIGLECEMGADYLSRKNLCSGV